MASSISETGVYYLTPTELTAKMQADPGFSNAGVKVGARVVPGSIKRDPGGKRVRVPGDRRQQDRSRSIYRGIAPDTFTDSVDVVVGGRMGTDGTFHATELLAKCASRYENAPENKYKQTRRLQSGSRPRVILIGELSLWVALLMAAWSTTVSYAGGALRRDDLTASGVRGLYATFAMVVLASIGLWTALLTRDFSLEYVASHISATMPSVYIFTAFWSGQAGSLLFWALILSMYGTIAIATSRKRNRELIPWATGTLSAILLFFIATTCFKANPFTRLDFTAARRTRDEPAAAESRHGDPSAQSLPRLRRDGDSVRVRDRRAVHAAARRRVAGRRAPLGAAVVVLPHDRHRARHVVGVRRARMERLLGVGSGGEFVVPAVADDDRVPALDHDSGKARHAAQVERRARGRELPARRSSARSSRAAA